MEKPDEKVLNRIRKILALSENNPSVHEAATAAAMAAKLMAKYNLDRSEVMVKEINDNDMIAAPILARGTKHMPEWLNLLMVPTAHLNDCEVRGWIGSKGIIVEFLGQKEDAMVCTWIFEYLIAEIERFSKRQRKEYRKIYGAGHGRNMEDYRYGLVIEILRTIHKMIKEKEKELQSHSTGTALVVRKKELIAEKFKFSYAPPTVESPVRDYEAYVAGTRDGKKIKINKALNQEEEGFLNGGEEE